VTSPTLGLVTTDLLAQDVFDVLHDLIPDLLKIDQAMRGLGILGNILVNPGFEIDQRAAGPYSGHATYTLDRWQISYGGAVTLTVSRETGTVDANSLTSAKAVFVKGAGTSATLEQLIEAWPVLKGLTLTWRERVRCSTPNAVRLLVNDQVGQSYSAYHSGGGGWETLSVTRTLDAAATTCKAATVFEADCTAYLDNGTLVYGSTPLPYAPVAQGDELARCQRYYQVQGGAAGFPYVQGYATAGGQAWVVSLAFATTMGSAPTVTLSGNWTNSNCGDPAVAGARRSGYSLSITSAAAGLMASTPNTATVAAEWNPS
jgi:hypothetical protein